MRPAFNISCALVLGAASLITTAYADDKDVISYRQHVMTTLNEQTSALGQILSTTIPDDNVVAHIEAIALTASTALKAFEPEVPGGEARSEVWSDWTDFSRRMSEFAQKTARAAKTAKEGGKEEVLTNIADTLNCKSCHDVYRDEQKE